MISPLNKLTGTKFQLSFQKIVLTAIVWGVLALLFYLLFSIPVQGADGVSRRTNWYIAGTYVFEQVAYLGAALLCFKNWFGSAIVSKHNVWLGIAFGMLSYLLGNLLLGYWELVLRQEPIVSPAELFFVGSYLFLGWGMLLAITSRRLNLELWQWALIVGIGLISIMLAIWISTETATTQEPLATASWVSLLQESVRLFHIVGDILLLIMATMLLLAFWGGRFAQSWRMIAAAVFSLYIADMWLKYAENHIEKYQSGALLEVFGVFSGVLFAIAAAVEYDISSRSRRLGGRRRP